MAGQILVVVKKDDRLEQMIPYLEKIAKPGTKVVFLIPYQQNEGFGRVGEQGVEGGFLVADRRNRLEGYSLEEQKREHKVFLTQEALRRKGVEIAVDIYAGRLRSVVERYKRQGDVQLIMMRAESGLGLKRFLLGTLLGTSNLLNLFNEPSFSPVLVLHPEAWV